ncbi:thiamine pyrophosphate-binding protein [Pseudonocardia acaciae]|uniref:thiamine pyrophosphate-binding protein n=1 Tax=Pseudonocardia acaciae TaxID=551276 RepID=UPI00048C8E22|nr:thiamine pyrophosphate-binding protein [Pseudonocardia acaciae]
MSTGGQVLVEALRTHGVDTVFGIPGTHNLAVFAALDQAGVRVVLTRHEQGAGYAADGYARVSGRPGVCLTTSGPAILNASAAASQAWSDSVPVLFVAPGLPTGHPGLGNGYLHEVRDQRGAMAAIVAHAHRVRSVPEIPHAVAAAFAAMLGGRPRPAYLEIPLDLLDATASVGPVDPLPLPAVLPTEDALDSAAALLAGARRPVIIAGGGARGASGSLRALAGRLGAPVVTSTNGKGAVDESDPLAVGAGLHQPAVRALVEDGDVVLAVGTELAPSDMWNGPFALSGALVRIDIDPAGLSTNADPTSRLLGDAGPTLDALLARLPDRSDSDNGRERTERARAALRADAAKEGAAYQEILSALAPVVDAATVVAGDNTMACYLGALSGLAVHRPGGFLFPSGGGTLGYGLPAAIGVKLAEPGARVLAILGDGGLMFTVAELATAAQLGLALPVLVVDNGGYGEIRNEMLDRGERPVAVDLDPVDFPALARSMGCHGVRISEPSALTDAVAAAFTADRPTLLHVSV